MLKMMCRLLLYASRINVDTALVTSIYKEELMSGHHTHTQVHLRLSLYTYIHIPVLISLFSSESDLIL